MPHIRFPLDDSPDWDGDAAVERMRKHASSDGTGDKDTINWPAYAKGFLVVTSDGHHFGDYHYQHHDVRGGQLVTVLGGVKAAAERIEQNLTGPELHSAQHHLGEHFKEFGLTPPWEHKPTELDDVNDKLTLLDDGDAGIESIQLPKIGAPPPARIRLFKWGWNKTTKGRLKLTQRGAEKTMAAFKERGNAGAFDLWHSFFDANLKPEDKQTVGHYLLSLEGSAKSGQGGLFAVRCQFSPDTASEISAGKWPYVSPVPLHTKDGEIVDVKNVSLVGLAATHNAQPLLMSLLSELPAPPKKESLPMSKQLKDCMARGQHYLAALKAMADQGEQQHRELANTLLAEFGPHLQKVAGASGDKLESIKKELAEEDELAARKLSLLSALETELGTTDPDEIEGKVLALQSRHSGAAKKEQTAVLKLLADNKDRVPPARVESLKKRPLAVVQTYLSELGEDDDLPRGETREATPPAPTKKNTEELAGDKDKPLTSPDLNEYQLSALDAIKRVQKEQLGDKFDEAAIETAYLSEVNVGRGK